MDDAGGNAVPFLPSEPIEPDLEEIPPEDTASLRPTPPPLCVVVLAELIAAAAAAFTVLPTTSLRPEPSPLYGFGSLFDSSFSGAAAVGCAFLGSTFDAAFEASSDPLRRPLASADLPLLKSSFPFERIPFTAFLAAALTAGAFSLTFATAFLAAALTSGAFSLAFSTAALPILFAADLTLSILSDLLFASGSSVSCPKVTFASSIYSTHSSISNDPSRITSSTISSSSLSLNSSRT